MLLAEVVTVRAARGWPVPSESPVCWEHRMQEPSIKEVPTSPASVLLLAPLPVGLNQNFFPMACALRCHSAIDLVYLDIFWDMNLPSLRE